MLEVAPAVDLAEHRPEPRLRAAQPVLQHPRRTQPTLGRTRQRHRLRRSVHRHDLQGDALVAELDVLDIEPDQRAATKLGWRPATAASRSRSPARSPGQAPAMRDQLRGTWRWPTSRPRRATRLPQHSLHDRIPRLRLQPAPAVLVDDRRQPALASAPGPSRVRLVLQIGRQRGPHRPAATVWLPLRHHERECGPVGGIEPPGLRLQQGRFDIHGSSG